MLMREQCFICTKNLSNINSILDAQYVKYSWRPHFEENKYILYFSKQNLYTCIPCGKQFFMWNLSKNKFNLIKNTEKRFQNLNSLFVTKFETQALGILEEYNIKYIILTPKAKAKYDIKKLGYYSGKCFDKIYDQETRIYLVECVLGEI